jgi:hypothetical protein
MRDVTFSDMPVLSLHRADNRRILNTSAVTGDDQHKLASPQPWYSPGAAFTVLVIRAISQSASTRAAQ